MESELCWGRCRPELGRQRRQQRWCTHSRWHHLRWRRVYRVWTRCFGPGLGRLVGHVPESLEEAEQRLDSLRVNTFALMSTEETMQNAARVKAAAASPGRKRHGERAHPDAKGSDDLDELYPLVSLPWNQQVAAVESESLALLGRKLRILSTWCNEQFKDQLSCTTHAWLQDEQSRLYATFVTTM